MMKKAGPFKSASPSSSRLLALLEHILNETTKITQADGKTKKLKKRDVILKVQFKKAVEQGGSAAEALVRELELDPPVEKTLKALRKRRNATDWAPLRQGGFMRPPRGEPLKAFKEKLDRGLTAEELEDYKERIRKQERGEDNVIVTAKNW